MRNQLRSLASFESFFLANVKHEARLTGSGRSMRGKGWNCSKSFELGAVQPLLSMRLFGDLFQFDEPIQQERKQQSRPNPAGGGSGQLFIEKLTIQSFEWNKRDNQEPHPSS